MDGLCALFGIQRQAHYQKCQREREQAIQDEIVLELVRQVRRKHPQMGTRKLLVKRHKTFKRTTISGYWRAPNLLLGRKVSAPNQVWVSDIT